jgi:hypothetical protein
MDFEGINHGLFQGPLLPQQAEEDHEKPQLI